jgi:hypothetical protein
LKPGAFKAGVNWTHRFKAGQLRSCNVYQPPTALRARRTGLRLPLQTQADGEPAKHPQVGLALFTHDYCCASKHIQLKTPRRSVQAI